MSLLQQLLAFAALYRERMVGLKIRIITLKPAIILSQGDLVQTLEGREQMFTCRLDWNLCEEVKKRLNQNDVASVEHH